MKFALIFIISLIATTIVADECLDICIRSLGASGCPQGSFCKNNHVCQALHWTTHARNEMCLFGYHENCPNTFPVSCNEARLLLNTAPLTTGIPSTTTTTPDFNQQIYDLIGGVRSIVRGEYQSDDLVGAVRAITRGEEINRLIRASVDNTIESFVHAANFVGNLGVPVVEYYQDMYCTETNRTLCRMENLFQLIEMTMSLNPSTLPDEVIDEFRHLRGVVATERARLVQSRADVRRALDSVSLNLPTNPVS